MSIIQKEPENIPEILKKYLCKKDVFFVFATSVSLESWADWCVQNPELSGKKAVSMEQFLAWDKFKEKYLGAHLQGMHAVPSLLKKLFVYNLIQKNAECAVEGKPLFKSIINPDFASQSSAFADWISSNISSLNLWHEHYKKWLSENNLTEEDDTDSENQDYLFLYKIYSEFLGNEMFEPSWLKSEFFENKKTFIIFYPEQMQDFAEYEQIFNSAKNIIQIVLPKNIASVPKIYSYPDARMELRRTVLQIRNLIQNKEARPEEIALHTSEIETYVPYIKREFEKYCIPFVIRTGIPMTKNCAGSIFENIYTCAKENFSYDSVRALLLNACIPWKKLDFNQQFIEKANSYHCLCNYDFNEKNDVWIKAFSKSKADEAGLIFYKSLKKSIKAFTESKTFSSLRESWFAFKNEFLDETFSTSANNILSRCITILDGFIELEQEYFEKKNLKVSSPYEIFLNEIKNSSYRAQEELSGVNIFSYKLAAMSAYKFNFIINCSQSAVNVVYRPVSFLNNIKRTQLNFLDNDEASSAFIRLYARSNAVFSYSEQSFSGFQIPHSFFEEAQLEKDKTPFIELDEKDFILAEKKFLLENKNQITGISKNQIEEYKIWKSKNDFNSTQFNEESQSVKNALKIPVDFILKENRSGDGKANLNLKGKDAEVESLYKNQNLIKITQTDMKYFFDCPRKWLLKNVLLLKGDTLDLRLFDKFTEGNIYHKILEILFARLKKIPLYNENEKFGSDEEDKNLRQLVDECVFKSFDLYKSSPLSYEVLVSQRNKFSAAIISFLKFFCTEKTYGGNTVVSTEKWLCSKNNENSSYALNGRIDCILAGNDDKGVTIIDYKNTGLPSLKECIFSEEEGLSDFQCAMYVDLWNYKNEINQLDKMAFTSINGAKEIVIIDSEKNDKSLEIYNSTLTEARILEDYFAEKVENCDLNLESAKKNKFSKLDIYTDCSKCNFKASCRTLFTCGNKKLQEDGKTK